MYLTKPDMKLSTGVEIAVVIREVAKQEHRKSFCIPIANTRKITKLEMEVVDVLRNNVRNSLPLILCSFQMYNVAKKLLITLPKKMIKVHQVIIGLIILLFKSRKHLTWLDSAYVTNNFHIRSQPSS